MEQHRRWSGARARLFNGREPEPKAKPERPVSPFLRLIEERRQRAIASIAAAFPPPGQHKLFTAAIVRLDEDGNVMDEDADPDVSYRPKWQRIALEVGRKHGVKLNELKSARRDRKIVAARHEAFWRCRNETSLSFPQIGKLFGGRDHSTVLHGIKRHEERMKADG